MRPVLAVVVVVAGLILVAGALNHQQTVSLDCVFGTWSDASVFVLAAIVAGLTVAAALLVAAVAGARAADDRRKLETELERTYARLRAAEGRPESSAGSGSPPAEAALPQDAPQVGVDSDDAPAS